MIRRINFTGRRKIPRSRVTIRLREDRGQRWFDAQIDLDGLELPANADVFVEAYHRAAYERFDFGRVRAIHGPENRAFQLPTTQPLFRVKVVKQERGVGRIIAAADKIWPVPADQDDESRIPLIPVDFVPLGSRVWRLELDPEGDRPVLQLNDAIDGVRDAARTKSEFLTLVYPEVMRAVLRRIVREREDAEVDSDDDGDWAVMWLRFVCFDLECSAPPVDRRDVTACDEWVENAVDAFCERNRVTARFTQSMGDDAS